MSYSSACGIAILAGGRSRRMDGPPKACLQVGDHSLLQRVLDASTPLQLPIWLIRAADPAPDLQVHLQQTRVPQLVDQWPDAGPLGGLATAMTQTSCQRVLLLACDLPFLTTQFLEWLMAQATDASAVVPADGDRLHPLCAVYDRRCDPSLQDRVAQGRLRAHDFLHDLEDAEVLPRMVWDRFDESDRLLTNINTAEDLEEARRWVEAG
ncbi:MAG: molybdenum cofactor guanylyltransferase [Gemmatimonadetes bacterium]|jgi:molybdenum cofactor guanylyltransferase|nr:molybdenum cofactor guanylyltransferase [Gemmatimonadota bacterium]MBT6148985.1 molybdenum cofactor guanylyltransferase [Gemmatimonadota bacterium]MBT7859756.1 molybdenum cofactor guanylyltransferase [Gemmatimonadota bacterium]